MIELRPCPFCGSRELQIVKCAADHAFVQVNCRECDALSTPDENERDAAFFWNTRALDEQSAKENERQRILKMWFELATPKIEAHAILENHALVLNCPATLIIEVDGNRRTKGVVLKQVIFEETNEL